MPLSNLSESNDIQGEKDVLGGGRLDSATYDMTLNTTYLDQSKHGATSVNIEATSSDGRKFKHTLWVTNRKGENFFEGQNGKQYLPGFNIANAIALLGGGYPISEMETETKSIKVYDFEKSAEVLKDKEVITALDGVQVKLGILKVIEDKNADDGTGTWVPTGETREVNDIDKVFDIETGMTVAEIRTGAEEPEFLTKWQDKWNGQTKNKAKGAKKGGAASFGAPAQAAGKPAASSLFANRKK